MKRITITFIFNGKEYGQAFEYGAEESPTEVIKTIDEVTRNLAFSLKSLIVA